MSYEQQLFLQESLLDYLGIEEGYSASTTRVDQIKNSYKAKIREELTKRIKLFTDKETRKFFIESLKILDDWMKKKTRTNDLSILIFIKIFTVRIEDDFHDEFLNN